MIPKKIFCFLVMCMSISFLYSEGNVYRYGIFVASSKGYNENDLPGAGKLVQGVASLFEEYCLLDETVFFEDPGNEALDAAFDLARELIAEQEEGTETQFFFYYYGHGTPEGLLLNNQVYYKKVLKEKTAAIDASVKFVFLDACSSQVLDGNAQQEMDFSTGSTGTVFITSSTQFQKAYTNVFTPILKTGLMGDADGFVPRRIDAPFFYNEIVAKLSEKEQQFIRSLYGLNEYYRYRETSEAHGQRMESFFTALGSDSIPEMIHINALDKTILSKANNRTDEKIIMESYDYTPICTLKKRLSKTEDERLKKILQKMKFKKDGYVTLRELFSYIQSKVAKKNVNGQRATITTGYLSLSDSIPLSYFYNKVSLNVPFVGTIIINKVGEDNQVAQVVKIIPSLDEEDSVNLALPPGNYTVIVEKEEAKYALDVALIAGEKPELPESLTWENLISYREGEKWKDKEDLDKKMKINKRTAWLPPFTTFISFTIPLSIIVAEVGYSNYLYTQYSNSSEPDAIEKYRNQITEHLKDRNNFYIAAGVCFAIPVIPFVIWMVRIAQVRKFKKKIEKIKSEVILSALPDVTVGPGRVAVAFNIKL